ncbi:MAG: hypothetical protein Solivirus1_83 [Solivirus sp.]|uniref:Ankyrin repeat protein n=1 Tax=Solivirus sp. TaxID=2487772 RepID=A0A3G5AFD1_9VIRU|nr:MAG: hypothetical protein Solivirus1_83 [Solivirus sp.]
MNLQYPSALQKRYANTVFPDLPNELIIDILAKTDHASFSNLCGEPEFRSYCSGNSALSERLYEERCKKKLDQEFLKFKPPEMKWKKFYNRIIFFVRNLNYRTLDTNFSNYYTAQGMLMELKIYYEILNKLPNIDAIIIATKAGHLDVLKWLFEKGVKFSKTIAVMALVNEQYDIVDWLATKGIYRR